MNSDEKKTKIFFYLGHFMERGGFVDQHRIEWGRVDYLEVNYLSKLQNLELFFAELNLRNTNFWITWRVN